MSISVTIKNSLASPQPRNYPWIGSYRGEREMIVLFTSPKTGMALKGSGVDLFKPGEWSEDHYHPYNYEIVLQNKE